MQSHLSRLTAVITNDDSNAFQLMMSKVRAGQVLNGVGVAKANSRLEPETDVLSLGM